MKVQDLFFHPIQGNERTIEYILKKIKDLLYKQKYLIDNHVNPQYDKELEELVMFLAMNTAYKRPIHYDAHLVGITPPISKCIYTNIIHQLNLVQYLGIVIEHMPIHVGSDLMDAMIQCMKKTTPKSQIKNTYILLKGAATRISKVGEPALLQDDIDNLVEVSNIMMQNLTMLPVDKVNAWKSAQIYEHMGYCLLYLFNLLLHCRKGAIMKTFLYNVFRSCCSVVQNITVDVFCLWAEIEQDDENLQTVIANKAYIVTECFQGYPDAVELSAMLTTISRKPKTLTEQVREADIPKLIKNIKKENSDQKVWFEALLSNAQLLDDEEALNCVQKYTNLCGESELFHLLDLFAQTKKDVLKKIIIDTSKNLSLDQLMSVMVKHFYRNKFECILSDDVEAQLTVIFNKISKTKCPVENLQLEVSLLLLQSPKVVIRFLYHECLKSSLCTNLLKGSFDNLKEVAKINDVGVYVLNDIIKENLPNPGNVENYAELFKMLLELDYFSNETVWQKILWPLLKSLHEGENLQCLNCTLQIILDSKLKIHHSLENKEGIEFLLNLMTENRCKFFTFNSLKQHIVKLIVDIILDSCRVYKEDKLDLSKEDIFSGYYKRYLTGDADYPLFETLCSNFDINKHGECVAKILQILPLSVTREWLTITEGIIKIGGAEKSVELLTDMLIMLCQLLETQKESVDSLTAALRYNIRNYGICLKQNILQHSLIETEIRVNSQVCRLLSYLPEAVKQEEGLSLANILTERSLKSLKEDKEFLCLLLLIKNSNVCRVLAQKMTC
ncbi:unnamed protein product [Callosobruchus maculatus]|uniref:Uncharacterized protein n=1 Tax=Callosobruchus maculatus TaxID=64391 RepID=A0A653CB86_CALMS|nr:unnamed protein product [Callosobruchus maculatus]